jgi:saccharopine dehydrogenase (NADP+, L-glutamate forming)
MKLEVYPNRDSLIFMDKFGMQECETFIRGTIRFSGFSFIISAFHDLGLTSDDPVPPSVVSLRDLALSRTQRASKSLHPLAQAAIKESFENLSPADQDLTLRLMSDLDLSYVPQDPIFLTNLFKQYYKALSFLGFYDDAMPLHTKTKDGKQRSYLEAFGDVLAQKLSMTDEDRDLVVMRHNFVIEENKTKKRWNHYSTLIASGNSKKQGGYTIMAKTVGMTAAIGCRLILEGRISLRGVLSPTHKEIYEPCLAELEKCGVVLIEESERFRTLERPKL